MPISYKVWDHIDVSDDEDDTHPNIEKASLFRWRHQARLEKMAEAKREQRQITDEIQTCRSKIEELQMKVDKEDIDQNEKEAMTKESNELEKTLNELVSKEAENKKKTSAQPWNVDTIAKDSFSKSRINKSESASDSQTTMESNDFNKFYKTNKQLIEQFSMLRKCEDSMQFLLAHRFLCCEETANGLVILCIDYEIDEKHELMEFVARQTIMFQYYLDLARELCVKPTSTSLITSFYSKFHQSGGPYLEAFEEELEMFKERIRSRAQVKLAAAEEVEREKRLGPGGLDPVEVFSSLPEEMQECFKTRDVEKLQSLSENMNFDQFQLHLKRCIDSGLWVADVNEEQTNEQEKQCAEIETSGFGGDEKKLTTTDEN